MGGIPPCDIGEGILLTPSPNTSIQCYITRCGRAGVSKSERERRGASERGEANAREMRLSLLQRTALVRSCSLAMLKGPVANSQR